MKGNNKNLLFSVLGLYLIVTGAQLLWKVMSVKPESWLLNVGLSVFFIVVGVTTAITYLKKYMAAAKEEEEEENEKSEESAENDEE